MQYTEEHKELDLSDPENHDSTDFNFAAMWVEVCSLAMSS
jgi:hypothetical protein